VALFARLRGCFPSAHFKDEDYLTEIIFSYADHHPFEFVNWLRSIGVAELSESAALSIATQYHSPENIGDELPAKRPDMLVWLREGDRQQVIFVESKIGSGLSGDDQLQMYARILWKMSTTAKKTLLFITRDHFPQNAAKILQSIPPDQSPQFIQRRWYDFTKYIDIQLQRKPDILTYEILKYMKDRQLDMPNRFTPADIASLAGFTHALNAMRAVIDGEFESAFEKAFGSKLDTYDRDVRIAKFGSYGQFVTPSKRSETIVSLGFYFNHERDEYPVLYGDISFDSRTKNKAEVGKALHECASKSGGRWLEDGVTVTSAVGTIYSQTSLASFLSSEDHVSAMRQYLLDLLEEIVEIRRRHPVLVGK